MHALSLVSEPKTQFFRRPGTNVKIRLHFKTSMPHLPGNGSISTILSFVQIIKLKKDRRALRKQEESLQEREGRLVQAREMLQTLEFIKAIVKIMVYTGER